MNERIDRLIEQCTAQQFSDCVGGYETFDKEKFAELIVKECVICAEREWIRNGSNTEHNQAVSKVIESIKQHFGVEECLNLFTGVWSIKDVRNNL